MKNSFMKSLFVILIILSFSLTGCAQLNSLTKHIFSKDQGGQQQELAGSTLIVETNSAQAPAAPQESETEAEIDESSVETETVSEDETETSEAEETSSDEASEQTTEGDVTFTSTNETVYPSVDLNARNSPSPDGEVAKTIKAGTKLTRIGIGSNGWDKIDYNGELYYMSHEYLTTQAP